MRRTAVVVVLVMVVVAAGRSQAGGRRSLFGPQPEPCAEPGELVEQPGAQVQVGPAGPLDRSCWTALRDWLCFRSLHHADHIESTPCCHPPVYAFFLHRCSCGGCACPDDQAICIGFSYTSLIDCYIDRQGNGGCPTCK